MVSQQVLVEEPHLTQLDISDGQYSASAHTVVVAGRNVAQRIVDWHRVFRNFVECLRGWVFQLCNIPS
jgi:hypothetical protein